ncbi:MAG TPA: hypothetical protein DEG12_05445 [Alistipes sp.]|jgi:hypothetical protein|uniref:hypothetical protein n=1 Tax=Alistipes sp. TaxID=1872444 RepID=UPI000E945346|nr:hypothetical protein [Alistipes sp.]HBO85750.1 hypothetical protein [Alistipes sp.]HBW11455.1 hypothetical protein [Alistipes sp.]
MRTLILCLIIGLLSACCPCKHLTTSTGTRDSLHVEIRHRTIWIPDTVRVQLPAERIEQTVRQDSSHLETSAAVSDARINPDGSLSHSLENKTDDREIPTQRPIEYRDSIVYRDREVEVEKIVEVERKLTWWQQTQIRGFWVAIIIILVLLRKKIFPLIRRFI